jgi:hypothetical protein
MKVRDGAMKTLTARTWTGIMILASGLLFYGAWILWNVTLGVHPVVIPVSLAEGTVRTPEFKVHLNGYYMIEVQAKKRLPLNRLDCMMGISLGPLDPNNCKEGVEPQLQAEWTLWSEDRIVDRGSSEDRKGSGGWAEDYVVRNIGSFKGESGKHYSLDVNFTRDGRALAVTDPHLVVEVGGSYYEEELTEDYVLSLSFCIVEAVGIFLLISSIIRHKRNRSPS